MAYQKYFSNFGSKFLCLQFHNEILWLSLPRKFQKTFHKVFETKLVFIYIYYAKIDQNLGAQQKSIVWIALIMFDKLYNSKKGESLPLEFAALKNSLFCGPVYRTLCRKSIINRTDLSNISRNVYLWKVLGSTFNLS